MNNFELYYNIRYTLGFTNLFCHLCRLVHLIRSASILGCLDCVLPFTLCLSHVVHTVIFLKLLLWSIVHLSTCEVFCILNTKVQCEPLLSLGFRRQSLTCFGFCIHFPQWLLVQKPNFVQILLCLVVSPKGCYYTERSNSRLLRWVLIACDKIGFFSWETTFQFAIHVTKILICCDKINLFSREITYQVTT